ncbi:MAG: UDP-N-acetylmuramoyl-L-alanine--D-glutamate ligase [Bacteroidetes bacterium]|nr:UDP-N-acetylmuramoyl-L-alanine--D-glutamate ligase [Bacteroidota bacterium]
MSKNNIVIIGAGESGTGSAVLARKKGYDVFVSDIAEINDKYKKVLLQYDIRYEEGKHTKEILLKADEVIKSPGIHDYIPVIQMIKDKGIPVISEIEFAGRFTMAKMICITGSNGKTTTALLTHHILKNAGLNAGLAGNVGYSFAMQVADQKYDYYVLEISSFQLDGMFDFKADIAILLNITPDHLDRYEYNFQKYVDSKFRIIRNQTKEDVFICCLDDQVIRKELEKREVKARKLPFTIKEILIKDGAYITDNKFIVNINSNKLIMTLEKLALQGKHNIYNSMAAAIAARVFEIRNENIKQSLSDFQNIEHRLEFVVNIQGIEFINDSKATNINSTWYALESINKKVILIAGGVDKGNDYTILQDMIKKKVKAIVCLGVDTSKIYSAFSGMVETIVKTQSMEDAVKYAFSLGKKNDVVLLSPACASFDLFENYMDRGNQFKKIVKDL